MIFNLNEEKSKNLPFFITSSFNKIIEIANNISFLKISDKEYFDLCVDDQFKLEIFFDLISIEDYKKKIEQHFFMKNNLLNNLLKNIEVFF